MFDLLHKVLKTPYPALAATIVASFLLFSPSSAVLKETSGLINDKLAHGILFMGLSFCWATYLGGDAKLILSLIFFAVYTEVIQYLLPDNFGRGFEFLDIVADIIGILTGLVLSRFFLKYFS